MTAGQISTHPRDMTTFAQPIRRRPNGATFSSTTFVEPQSRSIQTTTTESVVVGDCSFYFDDNDYDDDEIYFDDLGSVSRVDWTACRTVCANDKSKSTIDSTSVAKANGKCGHDESPVANGSAIKNVLDKSTSRYKKSTNSNGVRQDQDALTSKGRQVFPQSITRTANGHQVSSASSKPSSVRRGSLSTISRPVDCETRRHSLSLVDIGDLSPTFDMRYISSLYQLCYDTVESAIAATSNGIVDEGDSSSSNEGDENCGNRCTLQSEDENEELHRRNNREEIRRKLAMGSDNDEYYGGERSFRKPSLQSRLQSGMNLQICFMNETVPDQDVPATAEDYTVTDRIPKPTDAGPVVEKVATTQPFHAPTASSSLPATPEKASAPASTSAADEATDILSKQAKLQAEARLALAQAKQMAHMQMEIEKQRKKKSPIAEMVGIPFPDGRRKVSRQALSEMNVAQLQVIVNDLHTQIENLNEELVRLLLERDDLHMEQDSMLVDIEDLTRYL